MSIVWYRYYYQLLQYLTHIGLPQIGRLLYIPGGQRLQSGPRRMTVIERRTQKFAVRLDDLALPSRHDANDTIVPSFPL
jgi:hypothetical protein